MARRPRLEIAGGLYHVVARGNDRQDIFHSAEDHLKFIDLLARQFAYRCWQTTRCQRQGTCRSRSTQCLKRQPPLISQA